MKTRLAAYLRLALKLTAFAFAVVIVNSGLAQSTNCAPPPSGLVSWWRAGGDATDGVGANAGTLRNGATFTAGRVGQAFNFNGTNQFVEVPNSASLNPTGSFSMEGWIFPRQDRVQVILGKWGYTGDTPNQRSYIFHTLAGGGLSFGISDAANQVNSPFHLFNSTNNVIAINAWNHVAAVYDQPTGTRRIYVNGIKVAERTDTPITVLNSTSKVGIGTWLPSSTTSADYFEGLIDELSFYGRALPQSEIQAIYSANDAGKCTQPQPPCVPLPAGMLSWWRAEGAPLDQVGVNHGSLQNGATFGGGRVGQAFSFDGVNDYFKITNNVGLDLGNQVSIDFWMKADPSTPIGSRLAGLVGSDYYGMEISTAPAGVFLYVSTDNGASFVTTADGNGGGAIFPAGEWHHVAGTYDGIQLRFYLDGQPWGNPVAASGAISPMLAASFVTIGSEDGRTRFPFTIGTRYFKGLIDEVDVFNRALSASEILAIYNAGSLGKCATPVPPSIFAQPTNQSVPAGAIVTLSATASGTAPLAYQWQHYGSNVAGATKSTLTFTNVQVSNAGPYALVVTNAYGSITSGNAILSVIPPVCVPRPAGLVSWWRAEGNGLDEAGTNNAVLQGGAGYAAGEVGQAFNFGGGNGYVQVPASSKWAFGTNNFSIELWAKFTSLGGTRAFVACDQGQGTVPKWMLWLNNGQLQLHLYSSSIGVVILGSGSFSPVLDHWHHVAVTRNGSVFSFYVDGALNSTATSSVAVPTANAPLTIGQAENQFFMGGMEDEVAIYNRTLSAGEIQAIYNAGSAGKCPQPQPPCASPPSSLVSWWRAGGDATDAMGLNFGVLSGVAGYATGQVAQAFNFGGLDSSVIVPDSASLRLTSTITIEAWINPRTTISDQSIATKVGGTGGNNNGYQLFLENGRLSAQFNRPGQPWPGNKIIQPIGSVISTGVWSHVAWTYDQSAMKLYVDGVAVATNAIGPMPIATSISRFRIGNDDDPHTYFNGLIDEVSIYSQGLSASEIQGIYLAGTAGKCTQPQPPCASPPAGLLSWWRAGGDATDSVSTNAGILRNGATFIAGRVGQAFNFNGTNQFVEVPNSASLNPTGSFSIEGWIFSRQDRVGVILGKWGYIGDTPNQRSYIFHTRAGGGLTFGISDAANQANSPFHLFNSTNNAITINAWNHVAAVYDQPTGTRRIYVNGTKVAERTDTPITVLHGTSKVGIGTWFPSSATSADYFDGLIDELSFYNRTLAQSEIQAIYSANVSGKCFVPAPPTIVTQPQNVTVPAGANAIFSVAAGGSTPLSYQWRHFTTNLLNATNAVLTVADVKTNDAGNYRVVITNFAGSITSAIATLTVLQPPVITRQPGSLAAALGGIASFSVSASGLTPFDYQWQKDGVALAGQTNASLTITSVQPEDFGAYVVGITNADGSVVSDVAMLTLAASPIIQPGNLNLSTFTLVIPTEEGPIYDLEYKDRVEDPAWKKLTTVAGTGSPIPITDNGLTNTSRFYRVRVR